MQDIRKFIEDVVLEDSDYLLERRKLFFKSYLLHPNHQSATENIIQAILGIGYYAEKNSTG